MESPYRTASIYRPKFNSSAKIVTDNAQKILFTKLLQVKQLQNDLKDVQFKLNEIITENKILKTLQKRQDFALKKYEDHKAELPRLTRSQNKEVDVLRAKVKQLKSENREKDNRIKEMNTNLQFLKDQHYRLLNLSKDKKLGDREHLSRQMEKLKGIILDQHTKIQVLNEEVVHSSQNFKQQLTTEVRRRKETAISLKEALGKISQLEALVASDEKRSLHNKHKSSESLLSFADSSESPVHNIVKTESELNSKLENETNGDLSN